MINGTLTCHQGASALEFSETKGASYSLRLSAARHGSRRSLYSPRLRSALTNRKADDLSSAPHHAARPELLRFLFGFKGEQNASFWETLAINSAILIIMSNMLRRHLGASVISTSTRAELSVFLLLPQVAAQQC